eukprot:scaffold36182_cov84-Isochrysis_galbana.AAC.1
MELRAHPAARPLPRPENRLAARGVETRRQLFLAPGPPHAATRRTRRRSPRRHCNGLRARPGQAAPAFDRQKRPPLPPASPRSSPPPPCRRLRRRRRPARFGRPALFWAAAGRRPSAIPRGAPACCGPGRWGRARGLRSAAAAAAAAAALVRLV